MSKNKEKAGTGRKIVISLVVLELTDMVFTIFPATSFLAQW